MSADNVLPHMAKAIKTKRNELGIDQSALAVMVGLNRTSISNIESCRQRPTPEVLYMLCNALQMHPHDLFPPLRWRHYEFETITKNKITQTVEKIQVKKAIIK